MPLEAWKKLSWSLSSSHGGAPSASSKIGLKTCGSSRRKNSVYSSGSPSNSVITCRNLSWMTSTRAKWTILRLAQRPVDLGLDMVGEDRLQLLKLGQRFRVLLQRHGHVQCGDHGRSFSCRSDRHDRRARLRLQPAIRAWAALVGDIRNPVGRFASRRRRSQYPHTLMPDGAAGIVERSELRPSEVRRLRTHSPAVTLATLRPCAPASPRSSAAAR